MTLTGLLWAEPHGGPVRKTCMWPLCSWKDKTFCVFAESGRLIEDNQRSGIYFGCFCDVEAGGAESRAEVQLCKTSRCHQKPCTSCFLCRPRRSRRHLRLFLLIHNIQSLRPLGQISHSRHFSSDLLCHQADLLWGEAGSPAFG